MRAMIPAAVLAMVLAHTGLAQSGDRMPIAPPPSSASSEIEAAMNMGPRGQIAVRAVQGTKGGPAIGVADVEVELFHRNQGVKKIAAKLDEHGVVMVQDVPLGLSVRPVVRIRYGAATYQDVGPQMDATHPSSSVDVTVFEMTDDEPAWKITNRTLAIAPIPGELDVVESIEVENPADRTWMGAPADAQGRRATVSLTLPAGARNVGLEFGFHGWCCTSIKDNRLIVQMPLMPGKAPFRFTYRIDTPNGSSDVRVSNPVSCAQLEFLIPEGGAKVQSSGLSDGGTRTVGGTLVRAFKAEAVAPGTTIGLSLAGLPAPMPLPTTSSVPVQSTTSALDANMPMIIAIGAGVAILGGALYLYLRPPGGKVRKYNRAN